MAPRQERQQVTHAAPPAAGAALNRGGAPESDSLNAGLCVRRQVVVMLPRLRPPRPAWPRPGGTAMTCPPPEQHRSPMLAKHRQAKRCRGPCWRHAPSSASAAPRRLNRRLHAQRWAHATPLPAAPRGGCARARRGAASGGRLGARLPLSRLLGVGVAVALLHDLDGRQQRVQAPRQHRLRRAAPPGVAGRRCTQPGTAGRRAGPRADKAPAVMSPSRRRATGNTHSAHVQGCSLVQRSGMAGPPCTCLACQRCRRRPALRDRPPLSGAERGRARASCARRARGRGRACVAGAQQ
jgi:hypothetical protein